MIRYPAPLTRGATIGVSATSSGVEPKLFRRIDLVVQHLESQGYIVREGRHLRKEHKHVSAPKHERVRDFMDMWNDPEVDVIIPPWGGELLIEILPLLDFDALSASAPKWVLGYSDTSTLLLPLTLRTGIATAHGTAFMDMIAGQSDSLSRSCLALLQSPAATTITQRSSAMYQVNWTDFETEPERGFNLTEPTVWKVLRQGADASVTFSGRMIGGCIDTIRNLVGTPYGDLGAFKERARGDDVILYLENAELAPPDMFRALWHLRLAGWLDGLSGLLIGRSSGPDASDPSRLTYVEALRDATDGLDFPVVYDADLGHKPPQMTIVNGAVGTVACSSGKGRLEQTFA